MNNNKLAFALVGLLSSMLLLSLASVPLYNIFCKVTGFGGTTQRVTKLAAYKGKRQIKVRFDGNVTPGLKWKFKPEQNSITVRTGENALVFYYVENYSDKDIVGTSVYNVTPNKAGIYFGKIHCFCFEEQLLRAGQKSLMPVSFYLDPELENDPEMDDVDTITLSYSFFKVRDYKGE